MKVILLENIQKLGNIGEVISVKRGYARNFLISKKKALFASKDNIKEVEKIKAEVNDEPKTIMVDAPKAAPAETPIKPGSARGFLNKPCKQAPETDRLAPTIAAKITLGTLISVNIVASIADVLPIKIDKTGKL